MNKKFKKNLKKKRVAHKAYLHDKRIEATIEAAIERIKADNTVRPPVDYMGITDIRPDLLSLFVKPEGE